VQVLICLIELLLTDLEFSAINKINSRGLVSIDNHNLLYPEIENILCINSGTFLPIN
tara:strand:- start:70 stop:240 length:171 start_codon:yes stop_codon:yes gene_type:complete